MMEPVEWILMFLLGTGTCHIYITLVKASQMEAGTITLRKYRNRSSEGEAANNNNKMYNIGINISVCPP